MLQPVRIALIGRGDRASTVYPPLLDNLREWLGLLVVCDPVRALAES